MRKSCCSHDFPVPIRHSSHCQCPEHARKTPYVQLDACQPFFRYGWFGLPVTPVPEGRCRNHVLQGKIVLVTGGSRGIGKATCEAFVEAGCTVIGTSRHPELVADPPAGAALFQLDVRSDESVAACIGKIVGLYGRVDILVNNAGIDQWGRIVTTTPKDWSALLQTNLFGPQRVTLAVYPHMTGAGTRVITVGSLAGESGLPYRAVYAISKRGLQPWNDLFSVEKPPGGPTFTIIEPTIVDTTFATSPDVVNTEPDPQDPEERERRANYVAGFKKFGMPPERVAVAIVGIAALDAPGLRYYIADPDVPLLGKTPEELLATVYTCPPGTLDVSKA